MRSLPLGLQVPGDTVWHRLPTGRKPLGLVLLGVGVVALQGPWLPLLALAAALGVALHAGVPARSLALGVRPLLVLLGVVAALQTWQRGWPVAVEVVATTLTLVVLATTFTATTPTDDLLDAVVRAARVPPYSAGVSWPRRGDEAEGPKGISISRVEARQATAATAAPTMKIGDSASEKPCSTAAWVAGSS